MTSLPVFCTPNLLVTRLKGKWFACGKIVGEMEKWGKRWEELPISATTLAVPVTRFCGLVCGIACIKMLQKVPI